MNDSGRAAYHDGRPKMRARAMQRWHGTSARSCAQKEIMSAMKDAVVARVDEFGAGVRHGACWPPIM